MMRKTAGSSCLVLVAAAFFLMVFAGLSRAADDPSLLDRHQAAGLKCAGCHKERPPKTKPPNTSCLGCHGDQAKLAARTAAVTPNPHAPPHLPQGEAQLCDDCHHVHKPSEVACADCHHGFHFNVK